MYYIYEIYNDVTQKKYIGLTSNFEQRVRGHMTKIKNKTHSAEGIIEDFVKYGISHFSFRIIDFAKDKKEGLRKERRYIEQFNTYVSEFGYNGNDSRYRKKCPVLKCPDTALTRKIKKQGYLLFSLPWLLKISYRELMVKLNHPELFTNDELNKLNDYIEISFRERCNKHIW